MTKLEFEELDRIECRKNGNFWTCEASSRKQEGRVSYFDWELSMKRELREFRGVVSRCLDVRVYGDIKNVKFNKNLVKLTLNEKTPVSLICEREGD